MSLKPKSFLSSIKSHFLLGGRLLSYLTPLLIVPVTHAVPKWLEDWGNNLAGKSIDIVARATTEVAVTVLGGLFSLVFKLGEFIIEKVILTSQGQLLRSDQIAQAWDIMLSATNVLLFLALGIMSIMIVTGMQSYNVKKALTALIYAVFIANLSKEIVLLIVDLGDALTDGVRTSFQAIGGSIDPIQLWQNGMTSMFRPVEATTWQEGANAALTTSIIAFTTLSILAVGAYAMLKVAAVLIERIVRLALSIVFAPLIFILQLFPGAGLDSLAKNWWSDIFKWTLILPTVYFLLGLAGIMMPKNDFTMAPSILNALGLEVEQSVGTTVTPEDFILNLLLAIIAIALTLSAGNAASLLQLKPGSASSALFKPVDNLVGMTKKGGSQLAGAAWNNVRLAGIKGRDRIASRDLVGEFKSSTGLGKIAAGARFIGIGALKPFAKMGQFGEDTLRKINRGAQETKDALGKQHTERFATQDKLGEIKLNAKVDESALRLWISKDPTSRKGTDLKTFRTDFQDEFQEFRKKVLDANNNVADSIKLKSKRAGSFVEEKAKEEVDKGMSVDSAFNKLISAINNNKPLDIEKFTKVLQLLRKSSDEDERRDAVNALRNISSNPDFANAVISVIPTFSTPAPLPESSRVNVNNLTNLVEAKQHLSQEEAKLVTAGSTMSSDADLKRMLDQASISLLDKVILRSTPEIEADLGTATLYAGGTGGINEISDFIKRKVSTGKQAQLSKDINEARKITNKDLRLERIRVAMQNAGITGSAPALQSFAQLAGHGIDINNIAAAVAIGSRVRATGVPLSTIQSYAQQRVSHSRAVSQVQDLEDVINDKTANSRGEILASLNKPIHAGVMASLNDFDANYTHAIEHVQNRINTLSAGTSDERAEAEQLSTDLKRKPLLEVLTKAKYDPTAQANLTSQLSQLADVNHLFVSRTSRNAKEAIRRGTAEDIAPAAYAIKNKDKRK